MRGHESEVCCCVLMGEKEEEEEEEEEERVRIFMTGRHSSSAIHGNRGCSCEEEEGKFISCDRIPSYIEGELSPRRKYAMFKFILQ